MKMLNTYKDVIALLPMSIRNILAKTSQAQLETVKEIRLRSGKPIVIVTEKGSAFLSSNGKFSYIISDNLPVASSAELSETVKRVCGYSVYSHQAEINNGFITIKGGHRVGMCGTAVIENGKVISVKNINSINFRIAGQCIGSADEIIAKLFCNKLSNIIIAGPPMSGKTTIIRDLARQISTGNAGEYYKCAVVDERCEIAAVNGSVFENDIGENTDVLSLYPKSEGISLAVRTLSPDMVLCDETATLSEAEEILNGIMCGVHFAVSVHSNSFDSLYKRPVTEKLLKSGLFDYVVLLGHGYTLGKIEKILKVGDVADENSRNNIFDDNLYFNGELPWQENA